MAETKGIASDKPSLARHNVVSQAAFRECLWNVTTTVCSLLSRHCGPKSQFNVIVDGQRATVEPIFTKDGINVISSIESSDPLVTALVKEIAYTGHAVDRQVGDGTTTAMYVIARALQEAMKLNDNDETAYIKRFEKESFTRVLEQYDRLVTELHDTLDMWTITIEKLAKMLHMSEAQAIELIAYMQAMTSSHGDRELSMAIAKVFSSSSRESWKHISFQRDGYETGTRVQYVIEDCQYQLVVRPASPNMLTDDMATAYHREHTLLFVCSGHMDELSPMWACLQTVLPQEKRDCTIVLSGGTDNFLQGRVLELAAKCNADNPERRIAVFYHDNSNMRLNDLIGISVVCDQVPSHQSQQFTIVEDAKVDVVGNVMKLNRLYDEGPTPLEGFLHPATQDANSLLSSFLTQVDKIIREKLENEEQTLQVRQEKARLQRLYNRVRHTRMTYIKIGGKIYDNVATQDVATDALKAARSSLMYGFTPAANHAMMLALYNYLIVYFRMDSHFKKPPKCDFGPAMWEAYIGPEEDLTGIMIAALMFLGFGAVATLACNCDAKALYAYLNHAFDHTDGAAFLEQNYTDPVERSIACAKSIAPMDEASIKAIETKSTFGYGNYNYFERLEALTVREIGAADSYVAIQPANLYDVIFERFREVALRLLKTSECIVRGNNSVAALSEGV